MNAVGEIVEVGDLEGEDGARGFVLHRNDGTFITVKGLTKEETRAVGALLFKPAVVTLAPGAPP